MNTRRSFVTLLLLSASAPFVEPLKIKPMSSKSGVMRAMLPNLKCLSIRRNDVGKVFELKDWNAYNKVSKELEEAQQADQRKRDNKYKTEQLSDLKKQLLGTKCILINVFQEARNEARYVFLDLTLGNPVREVRNARAAVHLCLKTYRERESAGELRSTTSVCSTWEGVLVTAVGISWRIITN